MLKIFAGEPQGGAQQEISILTGRLCYGQRAAERRFAKVEKRTEQGWDALKTGRKILVD